MKRTKLTLYSTFGFVLFTFSSSAWAQTATINASTTNQYIRGFGASSAWHTAAYTNTTASGPESVVFWDATDTQINGGVTSALNAAQLAANSAVLFTANSGTLSGQTFLIVDATNTAGYQANADYVMNLTGATNLSSFGTANFQAAVPG